MVFLISRALGMLSTGKSMKICHADNVEGTYWPFGWWILLQELQIDTDALNLNLSQTMIDVNLLVANCSPPIGRCVDHFPNRGHRIIYLV